MKTTLVRRTDPATHARHRATRWSTTQLGLVVSAVAVIAAVTIDAVGDVPRVAIVAAVTVVAFAVSWRVTGRN